MKIGFSFGRCVRDIVDGVVDINDVLLIVGRTCMPSRTHCEAVIQQYLGTHYLRGRDPDRCMEVGMVLYDSCRVIEPRGMGSGHGWPMVPEDHVWMDLYPTAQTNNPNLQTAWEQYRMMIGLTSQPVELEEGYLTWKS